MSMRRLVMAVTFLAVFAMATRVAVDTDTWWHLATGRQILEHESIPQVDSFSYTRNEAAWKYPSLAWLTQITLYYLFQAGGFGALNFWLAISATLAFGFVYKTLSGGVFLRSFVIVLAAASSGVFWAARPYMTTFVLSAVFLWVLEDFRRERADRLWWLPLLMALWANSHGGFASGFILLGLYLPGEGFSWLASWWRARRAGQYIPNAARLRRLLLIGFLLLAGASLNPLGPRALLYPFETISIGVLQDFIQEWQSPNFHDLQMQPFAWLLLLTLGTAGFSPKRLGLTDFLLVGVLGYLSLAAARNIALFSLAAPMVLTRHASALGRELENQLKWKMISSGDQQTAHRRQRGVNAVLFAILLIAVGLNFARLMPDEANQQVYEKQVPVGAAAFLQTERPPGRLLNSYNWGGYLIWTLPEYPVFVDGRTDLYSDELVEEWLAIVQAEEGWEELLDSYDIRAILLEPYWPLVKVLEFEGWEQVYRDEYAVIFTR